MFYRLCVNMFKDFSLKKICAISCFREINVWVCMLKDFFVKKMWHMSYYILKNERCVWTCLKTFFSQKLCFVRSCCLEEGRLPLPVWRINSENKCDVCAQAFWWTQSVSEQIRSVHFEKENYRDTFLRKKVCWKIWRSYGKYWLNLLTVSQ